MTAGFRKLSPPFSSVNGRRSVSDSTRIVTFRSLVKPATIALAAVSLTTTVFACSGASAASTRTLVDSRDESDPRSVDPSLSTDVPTGRAVGYLFDGLTAFDAAANVKPALAERWDVSPD